MSCVFRCMLHMFNLDIAKVDLVLHMLQWLYYVASVLYECCKWTYTYVASVCFKCFIRFRCMLQVFYLDVPYVSVAIYMCCKHLFKIFYLFQTYIASVFSCKCMFIDVSPILDVCCISASCCNISKRKKRTHAEAVPTGIAVPTCAASEASVGGLHLHAHQQACAMHLHAYVHGVQTLQHGGRACRCNNCMRGRRCSTSS
jgi:hypothetical protein